MRVLFATLPLPSHLGPMVPLALELVATGHEVRVASGPAMAGAVAAAGLAHEVAGLDWPTFPPTTSLRSLEFAFKHAMMTTLTERLYEDCAKLFDRWRPDVVVVEPFGLGAVVAAELAGVPFALASYTLRPLIYGAGAPGDPEREERFRVQGFTEHWAFRAKLGLDPDRDLVAATKHLVLDMVPPSLHFSAPEYLPGAHVAHPVRPFAWAPSRKDAPPPVSFDGRRPLVHVTFGTVLDENRLVATVLDALADEDVDVLVAGAPVAIGRAHRGTVRFAAWIDHAETLPRCAAVIHHAGLGTTIACLSAGVPSVVLPRYADNPINAARLAAAGAAISIRPPEVSAESVRTAVRRALEDDLYRRNTLRLKAEIEAMPGLARGVELLEQLGRRGSPPR